MEILLWLIFLVVVSSVLSAMLSAMKSPNSPRSTSVLPKVVSSVLSAMLSAMKSPNSPQSTSALPKTVDSTNAYFVGFELANAYRGSDAGPNPRDYSLSQVRSCLEKMKCKCNDDRVLKEVKDAWIAAWQERFNLIQREFEIWQMDEYYYYEDYWKDTE
ncbi:MAG: hypothetical protein LBU46_01150 [Candidatus Accumulibacter sp.]|jgi:hypothetical protein|nr:hypothetical protein [Accumulibacter sp.]